LLKLKGEPESVHMTLFPEAESLACGISKDAGEKWERLAQVRSAVLVALEQARAAKIIVAASKQKSISTLVRKRQACRSCSKKAADSARALYRSQVRVAPSAIAASVPAETLPA